MKLTKCVFLMDQNEFYQLQEDQNPIDNLIISSFTFFTIDQIYDKMLANFSRRNTENSMVGGIQTLTRQDIEKRIHQLLYTDYASHTFFLPSLHNFGLKRLQFSVEEEYMILFLSRCQTNQTSSSLCHRYRNFFSFIHPFSSIESQIEKNKKIQFDKQSSIVESYATSFARLERLYEIDSFSQEEIEKAGLTQEDLEFIKDSINYANDKSIPSSIVHVEESLCPIDEIEKDFSIFTQMMVKVLAFLQTVDISLPILVKNFLIGDPQLASDIDFNIGLLNTYVPNPEGPPLALIMLKNDVNFYIENVGQAPIIIDGYQIWPGETTKLNHNAVIEMSGCDFVFCINDIIINALKEEVTRISHESLLIYKT